MFMIDARLPQLTRVIQDIHVPISGKKVRWLVAAVVALMGIMNGVAVLLPVRPGRLALLENIIAFIAPFAPSIWPIVNIGRTSTLILGFFLCLLSVGLARGKRRAWLLAIVFLPLSALAHLLKGLDVEEACVIAVVWFVLVLHQASFQVASDPWRVRQGIFFLLFGFGLLVLYSVGGLIALQKEFVVSGTLDVILYSLLQKAANLSPNGLLPLTNHAAWFLASIPWLSAAALSTGMVMLLRPVSAHWWVAYQRERAEQMRQHSMELVRRFGNQTLSFFALSQENLRYLHATGEGMVHYRLAGDVAVVPGDPVCAPEARAQVTEGFLEFCRHQDWRVAIYQAYPEYLPIYQKHGLYAFKIGEEAIIPLRDFTLVGSAMANVRTSCRRAEREGVTVQWYEGPVPQKVMDQLHQLSDAWLQKKGENQESEMGFSMGRFTELVDAARCADEIAATAEGVSTEQRIPRLVTGIAYTASGNICAFVTFTPIYGLQDASVGKEVQRQHGWGWALDLMRRGLDAPPGVIELLLVRAIERFRAASADILSLGLVAMADSRQEMAPGQRWLAQFVSEHIHLLETHRSLLRFKQKFHPHWESRYIVMSHALALPKVALAVLRVHQAK